MNFLIKSSMNLGLCIIIGLLFACSADDKKAQGKMPPIPVKVMTVEARNLPLVSEYVGLTGGSLAVEVRAQVGGILKKRNYTEGDYVEQGKILFEIDPDTYTANLDQAKGRRAQATANLERSKREWDRIMPLYQKNAVSQKDRDNAQSEFSSAKAELESAQAAVKEAEIKLSYAYVVAPISGYTSKESQSEGNLINTSPTGNLLTAINQLDPMFIDFSIPSTEYMTIHRLLSEGKAVEEKTVIAEIQFADGSKYNHKGEVTFVDTRVDISTSVIKARAVIKNPDKIILPGQFVRLSSYGYYLKEALLIKQSAMIQTQQGPIVMVIDEKNLPQARQVKLGQGYENFFVIESGLKAGDRIITEGVNKIRPGQAVSIIEDKTALPGFAPEQSKTAEEVKGN